MFVLYALLLAAVLIGAVVTSEPSAWEPVTLVNALTIVLVLADVAVFSARRLRRSGGLLVQTTIMALLGPAPAVAISVGSILLSDAALFRVERIRTVRNLAIVGVLGLAGGLLFEALSDALGISTQDPAYAALAVPIYMVLTTANLVMAVVGPPHIPREDWGRTIRDAGLPALPLELVNAVLAATAVLLWIQGSVDAAVGLLAVLVIVIPLTRSLMDDSGAATTSSSCGRSPTRAPSRFRAWPPTASGSSRKS